MFARDRLRSYRAAIQKLQKEGQLRYANNRIDSDLRHVKRRLRAMQGPGTTVTAIAVIAGIEAVQMIRKGKYLGSPKQTDTGRLGSSGPYSDSTSGLSLRNNQHNRGV